MKILSDKTRERFQTLAEYAVFVLVDSACVGELLVKSAESFFGAERVSLFFLVFEQKSPFRIAFRF